jgi:hypothetical protein
MLQNDSLLIDDTFYENTTDVELELTTVEIGGEMESSEKQTDEKALMEMLEKIKASSEIPFRIEELSSSEKASGEVSSSEKAPSTDNSLVEFMSSEKASTEVTDQSPLETDTDKAAAEPAEIDKALPHPPATHSNSTETSQNLQVTPTEAFPQPPTTPPIELLHKVPAHLLNKAQEKLPSFTKFVTVEKTSSKPSIVNGPFLIFGQPFMRPSSAEKVAVLPETSSQENQSFEYSTFDSVDGGFSPSTVESSKPFEANRTETPPTTTQQFEFTPSFPYENRIIKDDQQNRALESVEEANKFVYHHLPAADVSSTPPVVRFPSQRVRFPDEPSRSSFSWPRDNGGLMRFWQEQPLINDFKIFSRGHSNFRRPSYRRNQ